MFFFNHDDISPSIFFTEHTLGLPQFLFTSMQMGIEIHGVKLSSQNKNLLGAMFVHLHSDYFNNICCFLIVGFVPVLKTIWSLISAISLQLTNVFICSMVIIAFNFGCIPHTFYLQYSLFYLRVLLFTVYTHSECQHLSFEKASKLHSISIILYIWHVLCWKQFELSIKVNNFKEGII